MGIGFENYSCSGQMNIFDFIEKTTEGAELIWDEDIRSIKEKLEELAVHMRQHPQSLREIPVHYHVYESSAISVLMNIEKNKREVQKMERVLYWLKKTLNKDKQCNGCCMVCKHYGICKEDN